MRDITNEKVNELREAIYQTITQTDQTHEQKVTSLYRHAQSFMEVLDEVEGLDELLNADFEERCICDLFEGHAPICPRYIVPDYEKFLKEGSKYLRLEAPKDLEEALNYLLIFYKHVPSVTNYPVFIGNLDLLLEPFIKDLEDEVIKKSLRLFFLNIDRTILDSFCHGNLGPKATRMGSLILQVEAELQDAVPNLTLCYDEDITSDEFAIEGIKCALNTAKPSFANHKMFSSEFHGAYGIASCYNGLYIGGGAYTLCRLLLGHIARKAEGVKDFKENVLPHVMQVMAEYMDARIRFIVEKSNFFQSNFLVKEGFIHRNRFSAMFGLVGMAECVNDLMEKEGKEGRFGHHPEANQLGVEIMEIIDSFNRNHKNAYCEATQDTFLLHAQVGIAEDVGISPGTRIPIGEEPKDLLEHLKNCQLYHKYFPSGTGDIFPLDMTVHRNPDFALDIIKGAFKGNMRYITFEGSDSDVIRVTGYLVKRSEMEKLDKGENVIQNTTGLGLGASKNGHILERKVR